MDYTTLTIGDELEIKKGEEKRGMYGRPKIKQGALTKEKSQKLGKKVVIVRAWRAVGMRYKATKEEPKLATMVAKTAMLNACMKSWEPKVGTKSCIGLQGT